MSNSDNVKQLIKHCLNGDPKSHKKLFDTYAPTMYAICYRYAGEHNKAKDFLQEGFIKVFQKLHTFRFDGAFEGWLKRIFIYASIEQIRKEKIFNQTLDTEALEDSSNHASMPEVLPQMHYKEMISLINTLPDGYRTVFNMFVIEGFSHKEIAKTLGISESTSKTQLLKARNALILKIQSQSEF